MSHYVKLALAFDNSLIILDHRYFGDCESLQAVFWQTWYTFEHSQRCVILVVIAANLGAVYAQGRLAV